MKLNKMGNVLRYKIKVIHFFLKPHFDQTQIRAKTLIIRVLALI